MNNNYSNSELKEKLNDINLQLNETVNNIKFYYSDMNFARCIDNELYAKDCKKCLDVLNKKYLHLLDEYNRCQVLI